MGGERIAKGPGLHFNAENARQYKISLIHHHRMRSEFSSGSFYHRATFGAVKEKALDGGGDFSEYRRSVG